MLYSYNIKRFLGIWLLILITIINTKNIKGQIYPTIDTIEVMPSLPSVHDSIHIRIGLTLPYYGVKIRDSIFKIGDTIHIHSAYTKGFQASFISYNDTFHLGPLTVGKYYIQLNAAMFVNSSSGYIPWDSTAALDSFIVYDDISLYEIPNDVKVNVELYPNPTSTLQQIKLFTKTPQPLQIDLYNMAGQKVMEVYNGLSVQGQQEFEVNLSQLPQGLYLYHIKVGEEWQYLKTIKE